MGSQALLVNQLARARLRERLAWHNTKPRSGARAMGVRRVPGVPIWDSAWLGDGGYGGACSVGGHQLLQGEPGQRWLRVKQELFVERTNPDGQRGLDWAWPEQRNQRQWLMGRRE